MSPKRLLQHKDYVYFGMKIDSISLKIMFNMFQFLFYAIIN